MPSIPTHVATTRIAAALVALTALLVLAGALPAFASAEENAAPRIAIVRSAIAEGTPYGHHYLRVDIVAPWLRDEFGSANVTVIGDTQLASTATLKDYDVVVLVRQLAMSKAQRLALRSYVAGGGGVVAVFGAGRWDYRATVRPHYIRAWEVYGDGAHEWGEVSEVWGVSFYNDPITAAQHHIVGEYASRHPILAMTYAELGRSIRMDMAPARAEANEFVTIKAGGSATSLAHYTNAPTSGVPSNATGWSAAWANQYKAGRAVYFGCQIGDIAGIMTQASAATRVQARSLLMNSVRWAGRSITIGASAATASRDTTAVLSGALHPAGGTASHAVRLEVRKPGIARWSACSSTTVVEAAGAASWRANYRFTRLSALGAYSFRAVYVGATGDVDRVSGAAAVSLR